MRFISPDTGRLCLRILAAALGGYALCWAIFYLLCAWLPYDKATRWYLTGQLVPLPFLGILLWVFITASPWRALGLPLLWAAGIVCLGWLK